MLTIIGHLGLGDQIVLNGLVRHFANIEDCVIIFSKMSHVPSVEFMYRDISDKIKVIGLEGNPNTNDMLKHSQGKVLRLGVHSIDPITFSNIVAGPYSLYMNWVCLLYIQAGLHPNTMYKKFKIVRDTSIEFSPPEKPYIFIHDDTQRGRNIKVDTDKEIYRPTVSKVNADGSYVFDNFNIFKYLTILENASERHMMNSSYNWLVEIMEIGDKTTNFFHLNIGAHDYFPEHNTRTLCTEELWTIV